MEQKLLVRFTFGKMQSKRGERFLIYRSENRRKERASAFESLGMKIEGTKENEEENFTLLIYMSIVKRSYKWRISSICCFINIHASGMVSCVSLQIDPLGWRKVVGNWRSRKSRMHLILTLFFILKRSCQKKHFSKFSWAVAGAKLWMRALLFIADFWICVFRRAKCRFSVLC